MAQTVAQRFEAYGVDDVGHESLHEHYAGFVKRYAAGLHVEQSLVVKLSGSGAVGAFHLVVVYFELRFGIHAGVGTVEHAAACLVSVGIGCIRTYQNAARESTRSFVGDYIFEELARVGMVGAVYHVDGVVDMHLDRGNRHAGYMSDGARSGVSHHE